MIKLSNYEKLIIALIIGALGSLLMSYTMNTLDNSAEEEFIETASCDSIALYIEAGNAETDKVFASFSFNYNNETGEYEKKTLGFDISDEYVLIAEEKFKEFC